MATYELDWPPTVNTYYRTVMFGKVPRQLLSKKARNFKEGVAAQLAGCDSINGRLKVSIRLHAPTKRKYDIDNRVKAILDALQGAKLFEDDEQIDSIYVVRGEVRPRNGTAIVTVEKIVDANQEVRS